MTVTRQKTAIELIRQERARQITKEGWTPERDDDVHRHGGLAIAAACYAMPDICRKYQLKMDSLLTVMWPWAWAWWKPTPDDRIRELVKAGALIVAEIERLQRKNAKP